MVFAPISTQTCNHKVGDYVSQPTKLRHRIREKKITFSSLVFPSVIMSSSSCRFYENRYPEVGEVVMVNVQEIAEMGAYVKLLEYDIRVGKNEVAVVLRMDKEKGYIDLSKRAVSADDIVKCDERYNKSRAVHSILKHCAEKFNLPLEQLYQSVCWPLSKKYGHAYDAYKLSIADDSIFDDIKAPSPEVLEELKLYISRRLTPQRIQIRADVEVSCFSYDGIDAIKKALKTAEEVSTDQMQVKAKLVAAPLYFISLEAYDKNQGIALLEKAIENVTKSIESFGGNCKVNMAPKAVTATEDAQLQALLDRKEEEDKISSDEEDDEE